MNERVKVYPAFIWPCFFASVHFGSPKSGAKYLLDRQVYCLLHRQISNSRKKFMAYGFPRILSLIPCWELFFFLHAVFSFHPRHRNCDKQSSYIVSTRFFSRAFSHDKFTGLFTFFRAAGTWNVHVDGWWCLEYSFSPLWPSYWTASKRILGNSLV